VLENNKIRIIVFYKEYFQDFFSTQNERVKEKIIWTLSLIEDIDRISKLYLKYLENTGGLYEIRIQLGKDIFRVFCFFHSERLIIIANGFQKKTQKTPKQEIDKALKIKKEYENEK
jgi:phage-related protein